MNYNITTTPVFDKELKRLSKKHRSLESDILLLKKNIQKELTLADDLGDGFRKVRLNIKSKGKGKSGGGRIITYETIISIDSTEVIFAVIYDKSEFGTVDVAIIKDIISDL